MQTKQQIRQLLASAGVSPCKGLGQNFLIDLNLMRLLIEYAEITRNDVILEVGCGTGSLTEQLIRQAGSVIAVEIDKKLAEITKKQLKDAKNLKIINADILADKNHINPVVIEAVRSACKITTGRFVLVSNLPYNVASPVIINFVTGSVTADAMYVTVQKEVAQRMTAKTGSSHYGILSIILGTSGKAEIKKILRPAVFWPSPQVDSAIITYRRDNQKAAEIKDIQLLGLVVRLFMQHRRKMLKSCTKFAAGRLECVCDWSKVFEQSRVDSDLRAGQIPPEQFVAIANNCFI